MERKTALTLYKLKCEIPPSCENNIWILRGFKNLAEKKEIKKTKIWNADFFFF